MQKEKIYKEVAKAFAHEELFGCGFPIGLRPAAAEAAINAVAETYSGDETPEMLGLYADSILVHLYARCDWLNFRDITCLSPKAKLSEIAEKYFHKYVRQTLTDARFAAIH